MHITHSTHQTRKYKIFLRNSPYQNLPVLWTAAPWPPCHRQPQWRRVCRVARGKGRCVGSRGRARYLDVMVVVVAVIMAMVLVVVV